MRGQQEGLSQLAGIVLAAGGASRFGGAKQLAAFDGTALVLRAARLAVSRCPAGVVVVTGARAAAVGASLAGIPVRIAHNADWRTGLASSIRCGVADLPGASSACLILLCDQPRVDEQDLDRLIGVWARAPDRVAAAQYAGSLGAPAIFPASCWPALRRLEGDRGARDFIASLSVVSAVAVPNAARDIDTPADLDSLSS
jgi:molybdenum cofactor cytidylyltransferase